MFLDQEVNLAAALDLARNTLVIAIVVILPLVTVADQEASLGDLLALDLPDQEASLEVHQVLAVAGGAAGRAGV